MGYRHARLAQSGRTGRRAFGSRLRHHRGRRRHGRHDGGRGAARDPQMGRRLRQYRSRRRKAAPRPRPAHDRVERGGGRRDHAWPDPRAQPQYRARPCRHSRGRMAQGRTLADLDAAFRPHGRHRRHGLYRQGACATARRLRLHDPLHQAHEAERRRGARGRRPLRAFGRAFAGVGRRHAELRVQCLDPQSDQPGDACADEAGRDPCQRRARRRHGRGGRRRGDPRGQAARCGRRRLRRRAGAAGQPP
jgi:hypothetical protein